MRFEFPRCREGKDETSRFSTSANSRRAQTATLRWAPHRLPLFTSHAVCPVLSNRLRWVRGRGDSTTPLDLSRGDWGKRPIAEIEHEMDLGAAKKRENCQLSVWTRQHEVHRLGIWILDGGTWPRPNDDMAQSQRLLRDRISRPMGLKKYLHPLSHGTWR